MVYSHERMIVNYEPYHVSNVVTLTWLKLLWSSPGSPCSWRLRMMSIPGSPSKIYHQSSTLNCETVNTILLWMIMWERFTKGPKKQYKSGWMKHSHERWKKAMLETSVKKNIFFRADGGNTCRCTGKFTYKLHIVDLLVIIARIKTVDKSKVGQMSEYPTLEAVDFSMAMPGVISARSGTVPFEESATHRVAKRDSSSFEGKARPICTYLNHRWNLKHMIHIMIWVRVKAKVGF